MSELLKISILDRTDTEDFNQLLILLKEFSIETYVGNMPEYAELNGKEKQEIMNRAIQEIDGKVAFSILKIEDITKIKEIIESQIDMARKLIDKKQKDLETRYYILKDGDKIVSFHQTQLDKSRDDGRIDGWRNLIFVKQDYRGRQGNVIDSRGVLQNGSYNTIIYDDIGQWFEENGVNYERICTGPNMLQNIEVYICKKGFLPFSKNDKNIFLEKFTEHKIDKKVLRKVFDLYKEHRKRDEKRNKNEVFEEIESLDDFKELTEEQKQGLIQCFLKEEEKEFEIPPEKMEFATRLIEELQLLGMDVKIKDIPILINSDDERVKEARKRVLFGEQVIGKATINTNTLSKDNAKKRLQNDKLLIKEENKNLDELE